MDPSRQSGRVPGSIIDELRSDHDQIRQLYERWDGETEGSTGEASAIEAFLDALELHSQIEQELFYPVCRRIWEGEIDRELIDDAVEDHTEMDELINEVRLKESDEKRENFQKLTTLLFEHLDEEERFLFPKFNDLISEQESEQLCLFVRARKSDLRRAEDQRRAG